MKLTITSLLPNVPPFSMCILCKLLVPKILLCKKFCRIYFAIFPYAMFCKKFHCTSFVNCLEMLHLFTFTLFFVLHLLLSIVMVLCSLAGYSCEFNFKLFLIMISEKYFKSLLIETFKLDEQMCLPPPHLGCAIFISFVEFHHHVGVVHVAK